MTLNTILLIVAAVFLGLYLMRRRSRLRSDD
jgi:UPF0716 family protein affecting phage T7 exclusion